MTTLAAARPFEFEGVVRLTKIGVSFVIFTVVVGFAAINTGNNALYIGLSFMLGCLLLSGIASQGGLKKLRVEFDSVQEAWAGKRASGRLRILNRSTVWNIRDVIVSSPELAEPILRHKCLSDKEVVSWPGLLCHVATASGRALAVNAGTKPISLPTRRFSCQQAFYCQSRVSGRPATAAQCASLHGTRLRPIPFARYSEKAWYSFSQAQPHVRYIRPSAGTWTIAATVRPRAPIGSCTPP